MPNRIPVVNYLDVDGDAPHLVGQVCRACEAIYLGRRNACGRCSGVGFDTRPLPDTGTLRTYTVVHRSAPGVQTPFISAVVELDGGPAVKATLTGIDPDPDVIRPGMALRLVTFVSGIDAEGTEAVAFAYEPA